MSKLNHSYHRVFGNLAQHLALLLSAVIFPLASLAQEESHIALPTEQKQAIVKLLRTSQFAQLEQHYNQLQARYEKNQNLDDWQLMLQYQPFYDADPTLEAPLKKWIAAFPKSYPAHLARGIYYTKVAQQMRGSRWARDTSQRQFDEMWLYLALAVPDLERSMKLTAKPIVSVIQMLQVEKHASDPISYRKLLDEANKIDPLNYGARRRYLWTLTPRWGGSYEAMQKFLDECREQNLPQAHLALLESILYFDQGDMAYHRKNDAQAMAQLRKSLSLIRHLAHTETIETLKRLIFVAKKANQLESVADEVNRYLELVPLDDDGWIRSYSGVLHERRGETDAAWADYRIAATQGHAWSQFRIGQRLFNEARSPQEKDEGLKWIKEAASRKHAPAVEFLQKIELPATVR